MAYAYVGIDWAQGYDCIWPGPPTWLDKTPLENYLDSRSIMRGDD